MSGSYIFGGVSAVLWGYIAFQTFWWFRRRAARKKLSAVLSLEGVCRCEKCDQVWAEHKPVVTHRGEFKWIGAEPGMAATMAGAVTPMMIHQMTVRLYHAEFFRKHGKLSDVIEQLLRTALTRLELAEQAERGSDDLIH